MSIVYPEGPYGLEAELKKLRLLLPREVVLFTGGRAVPAYRSVLNEIEAIQLRFSTFKSTLLRRLMCFYQICRIMDHVGLVRTVAVLDYVGGHFEFEQSDIIFTPFSGPVLSIGKEKIMIESALPRASSLARLIEQSLD